MVEPSGDQALRAEPFGRAGQAHGRMDGYASRLIRVQYSRVPLIAKKRSWLGSIRKTTDPRSDGANDDEGSRFAERQSSGHQLEDEVVCQPARMAFIGVLMRSNRTDACASPIALLHASG